MSDVATMPSETGVHGNGFRGSWFRALNFEERAALPFARLDPKGGESRTAEARRRLEWWKQELKFPVHDVVGWRSREFGLDDSTVLEILGASERDLISICDSPPDWMRVLESVFKILGAGPTVPVEPLLGGSFILAPAWPWIVWSTVELRRRVPAQSHLEPDRAVELMLPALQTRLQTALARTFALELNVARVSGQLLEDTPEKRLSEFGRRLLQAPAALALFDEYPVLARILAEQSRQWVETSAELLARLSADWPMLSKVFLGDQPGHITKIRETGDHHLRGRAVTVIEVDGSPAFVYKPRTLDIDELFAGLLREVNAHGGLDTGEVRIQKGKGYAWMEYLTHVPCSSDEETARFYRRAGQLLATVFCLYGTDLHHENVIAHGEHPMLVDLECLFNQFGYQIAIQTENLLDRAWPETLLSTQLLPIARSGDAQGPEMSGFGGPVEGALTPVAVLQWENIHSDSARLVRKRIPLKNVARGHAPKDAGSERRWAPDISRGFRDAMNAVIQCRDRILQSTLWRDIVSQQVRYVAWPTQRYDGLLKDSYHPNLLRDAMDRDAVYDFLWTRKIASELHPKLVRSERRDLWQDDIPVFFSSPQSGTLVDAEGQVISAGGIPIAERSEQRIRSLDEAAIERHVWTIRNAFQAAYPASAIQRLLEEETWRPTWEAGSGGHNALVAFVRQIADRLLSLAFTRDEQMFWVDVVDLSTKASSQYCGGIPSANLYTGLSGFLYFFHYAATVLNDDRYEAAAKAIASTICAALRAERFDNNTMGGFGGTVSCLYALMHRLGRHKTPEIHDALELVLEGIKDRIPEDQVSDIVWGSAGSACVLLGYYDLTGDSRALDLAYACGQTLAKSALPQRRGVAWKTMENSVPLSGFAHGTSGIAFSLLWLADRTGSREFQQLAFDALEYDRSTFSRTHGNWLDLRDWTASKDFVAWCYGAPGVGLSRLGMLQLGVAGEECEAELITAFDKTITVRPERQSLCHGAFGNLEFLMLAAEYLGDPRRKAAADRYLKDVIDDVIVCGFEFDSGAESLNLMLGTAGCGYTMLRAAYPDRVPSVLLLEPPRAAIQRPRVRQREGLAV